MPPPSLLSTMPGAVISVLHPSKKTTSQPPREMEAGPSLA
jgi:hypothetical protein